MCSEITCSIKGSKPILIGFIYRNPSERIEWVDRFNLMMDAVANESKAIILLGDFNIDLLKPNKHWVQAYEMCNLHQIIQLPTRVTSSSKTLINYLFILTLIIVQSTMQGRLRTFTTSSSNILHFQFQNLACDMSKT